MIDVRAARSDPEVWRAALARKGASEDFDALMAADRRWLGLVPKVDELRSRTKLKGKPTPEQVEELKDVKAELQRLQGELAEAEAQRRELLERVPNPPDQSAPDGQTDEDAEEVRRVGEQPKFDFEPRDHMDLVGGERRPAFGLPLRLPNRRPRTARAGALPLCS
jgi:seryl-tRNA synthetase